MVAGLSETEHEHYAAYIDVSKKARWEADNVILGRKLDAGQKFLPDGLSLVHELEFLSADEQRFLSQVQARTYAYVFGLVERFINAKVLDTSRQLWLGDRTALEALVQFSDEETKYQDIFRRMESLAVGDRILKAYRWQHIVSGIQDDRFMAILKDLIDDGQAERVSRALGPML